MAEKKSVVETAPMSRGGDTKKIVKQKTDECGIYPYIERYEKSPATSNAIIP
jgi:hypothetical protein